MWVAVQKHCSFLKREGEVELVSMVEEKSMKANARTDYVAALSGVETRIYESLAPVLGGEGFELIKLQFVRGKEENKLRLFIDTLDAETLISIDQLAEQSRFLGDTLEVLDSETQILGDKKYRLEVSSPGVDRPLTKPSHFEAAQGSNVQVVTRSGVGNQRRFKGLVCSWDAKGFVLDIDGGESVAVAWSNLESAHLIYDFGK